MTTADKHIIIEAIENLIGDVKERMEQDGVSIDQAINDYFYGYEIENISETIENIIRGNI